MKNQERDTFWQRVKVSLQTFVLRRLGFWSSGCYDMPLDGSLRELDAASDDLVSKRLVILGREHYFETSQEYMIGDAGDLKKVLSQEPWEFPYSGHRFNQIERVSEQSHRVTSWVVKEEALSQITPRPWMLIPESACIASSMESRVESFERLGKKIVVNQGGDGLASVVLDISKTGKSSRLEENFMVTVDDNEVSEGALDQAVWAQRTKLGVKRILMSSPLRFWLPPIEDKADPYPWAAAAKLCVGVITLYLFLTSLYLWGANEWVNYRLLDISKSSEDSFELRRDVIEQSSTLKRLNNVIGDVKPVWVGWSIFLDMRKAGVTFTSIRRSSSEIVFYGLASRASDILAILSEDDRVLTAEFAAPVSKQGSQERFAIRILLDVEFVLDSEVRTKSELMESQDNESVGLTAESIKDGA